MPQNTNLNIAPYFDDFDKDKNFYRVLFRPGFPIQARELTTMQSILQNQVEAMGSHLFKEGAMVIPGQVGYDLNVDCLIIQQSFLGVDVETYRTQLNGKIVEDELQLLDYDQITQFENVISVGKKRHFKVKIV